MTTRLGCGGTMTEMSRKPDPSICTPWYATSLQEADGFATQPRDAENWIRSFRPSSSAASPYMPAAPTHRRHHAQRSAGSSRSPPLSAALPSPTCCAICSQRVFAAGGWRHDALWLRHDHLCRDAFRHADERLPSSAKAALERRRASVPYFGPLPLTTIVGRAEPIWTREGN